MRDSLSYDSDAPGGSGSAHDDGDDEWVPVNASQLRLKGLARAASSNAVISLATLMRRHDEDVRSFPLFEGVGGAVDILLQ